MKPLGKLLAVGLAAPLLTGSLLGQIEEREITYGLEYQGKLCGYSQFHLSPLRLESGELLRMEQKMYLKLSLLGSKFNSELDLTYHLDPATGRFVYHDSRIRQAELDLSMALFVEDGSARYTSPGDEDTIVELPPEALLPNTLYFPYIHEDFVVKGADERTYDVFDVREGKVQRLTYTKVGDERLELSGRTYETIALVEKNAGTGVELRRWFSRENGQVIKSIQPNGMILALADASVIGRIELVNLDESVLTATNVNIRRVGAIRFMRVKAVIEPTGLRPTVESLSVPGQRFEGSVEGNRIEGIFEIEFPVYDGADAPPFPTHWKEREDLTPFLVPEHFIEADDPVLLEAARKMVEGAEDSWDAARKIGRWVANNIHGAVPGGITARNTYEVRSGECGAHSFLTAALCRAVGIPARAVWGCTYVPIRGGVFGQHVWNEVYMGEAGWIPLDTTLREHDFVDSGHLRIGIFQSKSTALNGKSFEILDHLLADD